MLKLLIAYCCLFESSLGQFEQIRCLFDDTSLVMRQSSAFQTRSDTNYAVQPQKMVRGLNFLI